MKWFLSDDENLWFGHQMKVILSPGKVNLETRADASKFNHFLGEIVLPCFIRASNGMKKILKLEKNLTA